MAADDYTPITLEDNDAYDGQLIPQKSLSRRDRLRIVLGGLVVGAVCFVIGFQAGGIRARMISIGGKPRPETNGLLSQQAFFGTIPRKEVAFEFPTDFGDTGELGFKLWDDMMPLGAGFVRVPHPRMYDMPLGKPIANDSEGAEVYSVSMTHQLHCLAIVRDVILKYDSGSKSRFSGAGHEYHCLDYIRQSILCAGDTTLDHAKFTYDEDGTVLGGVFTGAGSIHQCRDWNAIKSFLVDHRSSDKKGILT